MTLNRRNKKGISELREVREVIQARAVVRACSSSQYASADLVSASLSLSVDIKSVLNWKWTSWRSQTSDLYSRIKDNLLSRFQRWVKMSMRQKNLGWLVQETLASSYGGVHVALTTQGKGMGRPAPGWPAEVPFLSLVWRSVTLDSTSLSLTYLHSLVS